MHNWPMHHPGTQLQYCNVLSIRFLDQELDYYKCSGWWWRIRWAGQKPWNKQAFCEQLCWNSGKSHQNSFCKDGRNAFCKDGSHAWLFIPPPKPCLLLIILVRWNAQEWSQGHSLRWDEMLMNGRKGINVFWVNFGQLSQRKKSDIFA